MTAKVPRQRSGGPPSRWVDLGGPVHYVDYGGPDDGPLLVCVHGLGGSLVNWAAIAPTLSKTCRVLALDLAGFGRTRSHGRSTSVNANQQLFHRFLTEICVDPAILVGNSMGGLISILQTAAHPETVAGIVLIDPALPVGLASRPDPRVAGMFGLYAVPAVGRSVVARRRSSGSAEELALSLLRLCCADPSRVSRTIVEQHLELARERNDYPDVDAELIVAARSLLWVLARRRLLASMLKNITVPVLLLHGDQDRLVPIASARVAAAANPMWRFEVATGVGHVPQLEVPKWTLNQIHGWLKTDGLAAAYAASP
ncbi:MAG TPA: alpha/beta hydrolase [Dermatophilaceae bacterium]